MTEIIKIMNNATKKRVKIIELNKKKIRKINGKNNASNILYLNFINLIPFIFNCEAFTKINKAIKIKA
jgi:hypothetical protein